MADFKPKAGAALPFLEYSQRAKPSGLGTPASPVTLLEILARQVQRALPMADLQTLSGMGANQHQESLKRLRDAGYIAIEGDQLAEVVRLTERGADVAELARPA